MKNQCKTLLGNVSHFLQELYHEAPIAEDADNRDHGEEHRRNDSPRA
jgi:hypothetical protein